MIHCYWTILQTKKHFKKEWWFQVVPENERYLDRWQIDGTQKDKTKKKRVVICWPILTQSRSFSQGELTDVSGGRVKETNKEERRRRGAAQADRQVEVRVDQKTGEKRVRLIRVQTAGLTEQRVRHRHRSIIIVGFSFRVWKQEKKKFEDGVKMGKKSLMSLFIFMLLINSTFFLIQSLN